MTDYDHLNVASRHVPNGQPVHTERHMRIICVGAGASGLYFAYKLQQSFGRFSLSIYEKNTQVGGTWFENRYPGVACDVPAHNYTYSFEPKVDWSSVYAPAVEIFSYFDGFKTKYHLGKYCKLEHEVNGATWDDTKAEWTVQVMDRTLQRSFEDHCDILINAGGILNHWRWPDIPGLDTFKGNLLHSANWDSHVKLQEKKVGLIGNGSSGIQILPAIQPLASRITHFIRGPTWVSPPVGMEQKVYTVEEKAAFAKSPAKLMRLRKANETRSNHLFELFLTQSELQNTTRQAFSDQMRAKLDGVSQALREKMIPQWPVGCRRLTPGSGYLEAFSKPNVKIVYGNIEAVTPKGIKCSGGDEIELDVLICATGFDTSFRPRYPITASPNNLQDEWESEASSYLGLAAPNMPNYFHFLGPNCPIGNGPVLIAVERQADYMLSLCDRWQTENIHSMVPKQEAIEDFTKWCDTYMTSTVFNDDCRSWYKSNSRSGRVSALWPGSTLHYLEAIKEPRYDDWSIKYNGNRFSWLGNGFSQTELDPNSDLGYYIRDTDDDPPLSRHGRRKKLTYKDGDNIVQNGVPPSVGDLENIQPSAVAVKA